MKVEDRSSKVGGREISTRLGGRGRAVWPSGLPEFRPLATHVVAAAALLLTLGCTQPVSGVGESAGATDEGERWPIRIVSLAPSVTETLYALGLGERVVGVTRFCDYPPAAATRPVIGGYLDLNYEAIVALEPDLAIGIQDHGAEVGRLEQIGVPTLQVDQHDIAGILESIAQIGRSCGKADRASTLVEDIRDRIESVATMITNRDRPRTLVVVDRQGTRGSVNTVWVAGPTTFYHEILELAGGENVISGGTLVYPELSTEGLLRVDPDVIVEVAAELASRGLDLGELRSDWQNLSTLRAVRAGRVHVLDQGFMVIPGPRVAQIVEAFAHALHPGLNWRAHG